MRCLGIFLLLFSRTNADLSSAIALSFSLQPSERLSWESLACHSQVPALQSCALPLTHSLTHPPTHYCSIGFSAAATLSTCWKERHLKSSRCRPGQQSRFLLFHPVLLHCSLGSTRAGTPSLSFHRCRCLTLPRHCAWPNTEYSIAIPYLSAASPPLFWSLVLLYSGSPQVNTPTSHPDRTTRTRPDKRPSPGPTTSP